MSFIEFTEIYFWRFSLIIFSLGIIYRVFLSLSIKQEKDLSVAREYNYKTLLSNLLHPAINSNSSRKISTLFFSYMLHIGLFIIVFFYAPHIVFISKKIGLSWQEIPEWIFIIITQLTFISLLILSLRRLLDPVLKILSNLDDHLSNILLFLVILTGCMALMQSFEILKAIHMLFVDLLLIYFPFSKLMHTFSIINSRYKTAVLYSRKGVKL